MSEDNQLLRRYAVERSEAAFGELVRRHVDLVYSTALRVLNGDSHRAQDVTQQVFSELARQANSLLRHPSLVGWLYTTTRRMGLRVIRTEQRRAARERELSSMNELLHEPDAEPAWTELRPVLEDAMHELGENDRDAVLLRYFENRTLNEVGRELGVNENAARMRVERALEKLRTCLARRGVTSTGSALALALSAKAVTAAPAGFVAALVSASMAGAATGSSSMTLLQLMTATKLKLGLAAVVIATAATTLMFQQPSRSRARRENEALRQQMSQLIADNEFLSNRLMRAKFALRPALPPPPVQFSAAVNEPPPELQPTNLYARVKDKESKLTAEQIRPYLEANRRNAASLLAAYRTTGDAALLEEAKQRFPNDPQVAFEAAFNRGATADDRKQWLETFKKSDPGNSLPNYMAAVEYFKAGQSSQAVQELIAASGKSAFQDYTMQRIQDDEDAFLAAGYTVAEAKTIPARQLLLPQLLPMKELSQQMIELANSYKQSGDNASAEAVLQMTANLGQRYSAGSASEAEVSQLVGLAVERNALRAMDPTSSYGDGLTAQQRLDQIAQQNEAIKQLNAQLEPILEKMSDQDWISYKDRWRTFGEEAAVRWVVAKYGEK